jgi:NodT family efflux transporter outer membrane factor (OMF) lipoprotein
MVTTSRRMLALGVATTLCACSVGPDYQIPEISIPVAFGSAARTTVLQDPEAQSESLRWWRTLHDPILNRLVERAVACNPDIEIALTRVQAARTQQIVVIGSALPQAGGSAGIGAGTGTDLTRGRVSAPIRGGENNAGLNSITRAGGFDTGWELDLFGKYRRLLEAVRDDAQAANEFRNAVLITVIADVVRGYVAIRSLQERFRILNDAIKTAQKSVDLVQSRFDRGLTNELDLTLAKRQLASVKARVPDINGALSAAGSRLSLLLGEYSGEAVREVRGTRGLPRVPSRLRAGVPADLLRRRPDIREAERELASAVARIGVETARLFPEVTMTAGIGVQGGDPSGKAPAIGGPIWSAGPGGYWPVLDFGRLDALIDIQELRAHDRLVNYKKAILFAVEEVDTAIKLYRLQQQRLRELAVALEQSRRAVDLATERYERGLTDFLNVLDAQRQEFDIEDQYAVAQEAVVVQYIALYKALGGGWELYDELPPLHEAQPAIVATVRRLTNDWH